MDLTVLDLCTTKDHVVMGNQEVDGTALFSGEAHFRSPIHVATLCAPHDNVTVPLMAEQHRVVGRATAVRHLGTVDLSLSLFSAVGDSDDTNVIALGTLPPGWAPTCDVFVSLNDTGSWNAVQNVVVRISCETGLMECRGTTASASRGSVTGHACWIILGAQQ